MTAASTGPAPGGRGRPPGPRLPPKGHPGWIVAGSLVTGALAAVLLAAAPFIPATGSGVSGAILAGFALGWALLAVLSVKFTDQPQRWAAAPALFMGLTGFLLVASGPPVHQVLAWAGPPALLVLTAWTTIKVHRQLRSRSGRLLLYPVIAMLVAASLGAGYETVREAADATASPVRGRLIDVGGGQRRYLDCTGSGSPTVVLEPGAGQMSSDLGWIAPVVARATRVCVYDRAGRGWSDPADSVQDGARIAADLRTLLERGNEPGPYVLAGHSFGGLYALTFAARYPGEVAGLVLVDSTAPAPDRAPAAAHPAGSGPDDTTNRASALVSGAARLGLGLLFDVPTHRHFRSTIEEYAQAGSSTQQAAELKDFNDKPLVVLTAGSGSRPGWAASQEALASLSTNSVRRIIDGATHASLLTDQEDAAATAQGILDVVSAVRTAGRLTP